MKKLAATLVAIIALTAVFSACGILGLRSATGGDAAITNPPPTDAPDTDAGGVPGDSTAPPPPITDAPPAETDAPPVETPQETDVISFIATGDNIIHEAIYTDAKNRAAEGQNYNFFDMYADIYDFVQSADIAFVNQETPVAGAEFGIYGYPNFNGPDEAAYDLLKVGFNVVNVASNHMLDMKTAGLASMLEFWKAQPDITVVGGYENQSDYDNIRVTEYGGVKIAWLSYTYGTNGMTLDASSPLIIPLFDRETIIRQLALAKKAGDLVFVSCHWGAEDSFTPTEEQKMYAQLMADNGADVIIGHHPHTLQPVEYLDGADGNRTLVIYSLGNMLSTMHYGRNMVGGFIKFDIVPRAGEKPAIENVKFVPTVTHYSLNRDGLQVYLLDDYTEQLAAKHGCTLYSEDFSLERARRYVTDTVSAEFLD